MSKSINAAGSMKHFVYHELQEVRVYIFCVMYSTSLYFLRKFKHKLYAFL